MYPCGSEAKDNAAYHHGGMAKDDATYCPGSTLDCQVNLGKELQ
jgi:hypothetical protein